MINLNIEDYNYSLPNNRIAQYQLEERDSSKLLIYKEGMIEQDVFSNIVNHLSSSSLLVLNDTKVIHARLLFKKDTGSIIEIFCLEEFNEMTENGVSEWKCLVGNNKRWKLGKLTITANDTVLIAEKLSQQGEEFIIKFTWTPSHLIFSEILEVFGRIPLPPYINRVAEEKDNTNYQTVFARQEGSVAAPTAGLHFTEKVFKTLDKAGIERDYITLHVGAGTFKPVVSSSVFEHKMHEEHFSVSRKLIAKLIDYAKQNKPVIPVGTTSLRTLESLYWLGVKAIQKKPEMIFIDQWDAYKLSDLNVLLIDALSALLAEIDRFDTYYLYGVTRLMIVPGYKFKIAKGIITNFDQPQSTLLLLVAAMIGEKWKEAYQYAIAHDFRFLSYGDCCLFFND